MHRLQHAVNSSHGDAAPRIGPWRAWLASLAVSATPSETSLVLNDILNVRVSSVEELAQHCARFHDFPFELEDQSFDAAQRTWTGYFVRGTSDPARVVTTRRPWLVKVTEFPIFEVRVTVRNVVEAEIQDRAQIAWHTFRQVHRTADGCRFEFHQDCDIYLTVDGAFDAEICDVRELTDTCGRITSIGFIDFGIQVGAILPERPILSALLLLLMIALPGGVLAPSSGAIAAQVAGVAGRVADATGAPLPGVSVTAMAESSGETSQTTTDRDGTYTFGTLREGTHRLDFDLAGFDLIRRNGVRVRSGAPVNIDAVLPISAICECVASTWPDLRRRIGRVMDDEGRPVPYARLEIASPARREVAYADREGWFAVLLPLDGTWPLSASDSTRAVTQRVRGRMPDPIELKLPRAGNKASPEFERLARGCRCGGDLFVHAGR